MDEDTPTLEPPAVEDQTSNPKDEDLTDLEKASLKQNAVDCQYKLAELLKTLAKRKRAANSAKMTNEQANNPGPSGDQCKPLRKAKYSWQVKNKSSQSQRQSSLDSGASSSKDDLSAAGESSEPPLKRLKLAEDIHTDSSAKHSSGSKRVRHNSEPSLSTLNSSSTKKPTSSSSGRDLPSAEGPSTAVENAVAALDQSTRERSVSNTPAGVPPQLLPPPPHRSSSVLARWQSKHIAQSIVDNAINATLEVLGYSLAVGTPNPGQAVVEAARSQVIEDDAVSVVIQARGLQGTEQGHSSSSRNQHSDTETGEDKQYTVGLDESVAAQRLQRQNPLNPLINRLTQFSDNMASIEDELKASTDSLEAERHETERSGIAESVESESKTVELDNNVVDLYSSEVDLENLFSPTLQNDVLNKAVSAAISQKGLVVDDNL